MATELSVHAVHQGGMRINATNGEHTINMDYPMQPGDEKVGFTPLELILAALAGCAGNTVSALLRHGNQPLEGLEVFVKGTRKEEHPTVLTRIDLEFVLKGKDLSPEAVEGVIRQSEELIAPVWAMIKAGTPINHFYRIE
jgi:putative redox protein